MNVGKINIGDEVYLHTGETTLSSEQQNRVKENLNIKEISIATEEEFNLGESETAAISVKQAKENVASVAITVDRYDNQTLPADVTTELDGVVAYVDSIAIILDGAVVRVVKNNLQIDDVIMLKNPTSILRLALNGENKVWVTDIVIPDVSNYVTGPILQLAMEGKANSSDIGTIATLDLKGADDTSYVIRNNELVALYTAFELDPRPTEEGVNKFTANTEAEAEAMLIARFQLPENADDLTTYENNELKICLLYFEKDGIAQVAPRSLVDSTWINTFGTSFNGVLLNEHRVSELLDGQALIDKVDNKIDVNSESEIISGVWVGTQGDYLLLTDEQKLNTVCMIKGG